MVPVHTNTTVLVCIHDSTERIIRQKSYQARKHQKGTHHIYIYIYIKSILRVAATLALMPGGSSYPHGLQHVPNGIQETKKGNTS
jgi:hypothetical protein